MDLLQIIKLVSIPRWVKFSSLAVIFGFIGLAIYAILGGAHLAEGNILQAGMGLLGVLLPLSVAIMFLSFYEAGTAPLKDATKKVLTQLIPKALSNLKGGAALQDGRPLVETRFAPEHSCHYRMVFPDKSEMRMELQLNVKKVCVIFCFRLDCFLDVQGLEKRLRHTLEGARHEGYTTNNAIGHSMHDGLHCNSLVLYRNLPPDFLWNSAEKLYFAQDLQVMIQSMLHEAGDWLSSPQASA